MTARDLADERNVVLTGFMGTGKTTVGRRLADRLGFDFIDTDAIIEASHGAIAEVFREQGEEGFRRIEREVASEIADNRRVVISTGGRMMLDPANVRSLSRNGRVYCLVASPDEILGRLAAAPQPIERPLLAGSDPRRRVIELLASREVEYRRFAQLSTDARSPASLVDDLVALSRAQPRRIEIVGPRGSHDCLIGAALLPCVRDLADIDGPLVTVTNEETSELLLASSPAADLTIALPRGDGRNVEAERQRFDDLFLGADFDRSATIMSLGDGVVGSVAAAASSRLGVDWVHCPTDLSAVIDSTIGGREPRPRVVVVDVATLQFAHPLHARVDVGAMLAESAGVDSRLLVQVEKNEWPRDAHSLPGVLGDLESVVALVVSGDW